MKLMILVLKNVLRSRRRTLLTTMSMTFSFLIFALLLSAATTVGKFHETISPLTINVTDQNFGLTVPYEYVKRIKEEVPGVTAVMGFCPLSGYVQEADDPFRFAAIDADTMQQVWADERETEGYKDFQNDKKGAVVSKILLNKYHLNVGDRFIVKKVTAANLEAPPMELDLTVRAVNPPGPWGAMSYVHREYFDEIAGKIGKVNMICFNVESEKHVEPAIDMVKEKFPGLSCVRASQTLANALTTFQNVNRLLIPITVAIVVAIVLVAANSLAISIRSRTSEVAVLKTLGFTNGEVRTLILVESTLISFIGGCAGCLIAWFCFSDMTLPVAQRATINISGDIVMRGIVLSAIVGLFSGLIPAWRASRLKIVDALRRVA